MDNGIGYSTPALNVLGQFESADFIIYVEGKDDVEFWNYRFSKLTNSKFEIIKAGCSREVEKKSIRLLTKELV